MTNLKFRAWHKDTEKFLKIIFINFADENIQVVYGGYRTILPIEDVEIMQSTGLFDKNGKVIFEGDIVKGFYNYSTEIKRAVIKFRIGRFEIESFRNISIDEFLLGNKTNLEIIGNIYENPELLNS